MMGILFLFVFKESLIEFKVNESTYGEVFLLGLYGFMVFVILTSLLSSYELEITETELVKRSIFGFYEKRILREKLTIFEELEYNSEGFSSTSLFLRGDKVKIEISSLEMSNYFEIRHELTQELKKDNTYQKHWDIFSYAIILIFIIVFLGLIVRANFFDN